MSYSYVTENELAAAADEFINAGLSDDQIRPLLTQVADRLENERSLDYGPPNLLKSLAVGVTNPVAGLVGGLATYTPGEWIIDPYLRKAAEKIEGITPETWQRASNEMIRRGGVGKYFHLAAQQLPYVALIHGGQALGGAVGSVVGAGIGGPKGTAVGGAVGKIGGGIATAALIEGYGLSKQLVDAGVSQDIADKYSMLAGPAMGTVEYSQAAMMAAFKIPGLRRLSGIGKMALKKVPGRLRPVARSLGFVTIEGEEEVVQGLLGNLSIGFAVAEENERREKMGLRPIDADNLKKNLLDAGISAALVAPIVRVAYGVGYRAAATPVLMKKARANIKQIETQEDVRQDLLEEDIRPWEISRVSTDLIAGRSTIEYAERGLDPQHVQGFLGQADRFRLNQLAATQKIKTKGKSDAELRSILASRMPIEGPVTKPDGTVVFRKPVVNPVPIRYAQWGETVDRNLRRLLSDAVNVRAEAENRLEEAERIRGEDLTAEEHETAVANLPGLSQEAATYQYIKLWRNAILSVPIYGESVADKLSPQVTEIDPGKTFNLDEVLPNDSYTWIIDHLKGSVKQYVKTEYIRAFNIDGSGSERAAATIESRFDSNTPFRPDNLYTREGKPVDAQINPIALRRFGGVRPQLPLLMKAEAKTNARFVDLDNGVQERARAYKTMVHRIQKHIRDIYHNKVPVRWMTKPLVSVKIPGTKRKLHVKFPGKGRGLMDNIITYHRADDHTRRMLRKQLKVPESLKDREVTGYLINDFMKQMDLKGDDVRNQIRKTLAEVSKDFTDLYRWFARNGIVTPDRWLQKYVPRIYESNAKTPEEFREWVNDPAHPERRMPDNEMDDVMSILDFTHSLNRRGYTKVSRTHPFMEYSRRSSESFISDVRRLVTDPVKQADIYTRRALRLMYFEDLVPVLNSFMEETRRLWEGELGQQEKRDLDNIFKGYFEGVFGIPTEMAQKWNNLDILNSTGFAGHSIARLISKWNDSFLSKYYKMPEHITAGDVWNSGILYLFATTLGIVPNFTAPIKNIVTQNPFAMVLGRETYFQGLWRIAHDKELVKRLQKMNLRPIFTPLDVQLRLGTGMISSFAEIMLSVYKMSDLINVYSSAAAAITAFERTTNAWEESDGTLTRDQIRALLVDNELKRQDEIDVLKQTSFVEPAWKMWKHKAIWEGIQMRGLTHEVAERILENTPESLAEAEKMFTHYIVELTQWRYGAGGTGPIMRNPLARGYAMYTTWSTNYLDFMSSVLNPRNGLFFRAVQMSLFTMFLLMLISFIPIDRFKKTPTWALAGPLPAKTPHGPMMDLMDKILTLTFGSTKALQEQALLQDESDQFWTKEVRKEWKDLIGD
jgi:hypothetical protein